MALTRCPRCDTQVEVDDRDLGFDVECPNCREVFVARAGGASAPARRPARRDDEDDRPRRRNADDEDDYDRPRRRRRRRDYDDDYYDDPEELIADARKAVFLPGLFTVIVCSLGILLAILDLVMFATAPQMMKQGMQGNPFLKDVPIEALILIRVFAIIWESVILAGASAMMRMRSYKFAKAAMVMRIIPFAGFCCILGFPFGIWGLTALNKPEVKDGFEEARRQRERAERGSARDRDHRGYDEDEEG